jgi:hypothetical protein
VRPVAPRVHVLRGAFRRLKQLIDERPVIGERKWLGE